MTVKFEHQAPSRYFTRTELECRCCGDCLIDPQALQMLDEVRSRVGFPLHLTSAYRCPIHNKAVGGAENSQHLKGRAFDVTIEKEPRRSHVAFVAARVGFTGLGVYRSFLHLDIGPGRVWYEVRKP